MHRLAQGDIDKLQGLLGKIYDPAAAEDFWPTAIRALAEVIPYDICAYNEVDLRKRDYAYMVEPETATFPDCQRVFAAHMHELPFFTQSKRLRKAPAYTLSDFMSVRQFRNRAIYTEFYRQFGTRRLMVGHLSRAAHIDSCLAVLRSANGDFTGRERALLALVGPHLARASGNARLLLELRGEISLLQRGVEELAGAVVIARRDGTIRRASMRAMELIDRYVGFDESRNGCLPARLADWASARLAPIDEVQVSAATLAIDRLEGRLLVRIVKQSDGYLLAMDETALKPDADALTHLGLSRREAEVLSWVAAGKTNRSVAAILGISPRTVQHTLERIYRKLGVESRTAAAARAFAPCVDRRP